MKSQKRSKVWCNNFKSCRGPCYLNLYLKSSGRDLSCLNHFFFKKNDIYFQEFQKTTIIIFEELQAIRSTVVESHSVNNIFFRHEPVILKKQKNSRIQQKRFSFWVLWGLPKLFFYLQSISNAVRVRILLLLIYVNYLLMHEWNLRVTFCTSCPLWCNRFQYRVQYDSG